MAWTVERMRAKLAESDVLVERAILKLYQNQTADEQLSLLTRHENGIGFNGADAYILSSFAEQIQKSTWPEGRRLSHKQRQLARKRLPKYARQLLTFAS